MITRNACFIALLAIGLPLAATAQESVSTRGTVLLVDRVARTAHVPVARRGQSMDTVEREFGAPESRQGPVGDPPITRWNYAEFTVYFEGNRVIHAVVNRASATESLD